MRNHDHKKNKINIKRLRVNDLRQIMSIVRRHYYNNRTRLIIESHMYVCQATDK